MAVALTTATTTHLLFRRIHHLPINFSSTTATIITHNFSLLHSKPSYSLSSSTFSTSTSTQALTLETDNELDNQIQPDLYGNINGDGETGRNLTVLDAKRKVPNLTMKEKKELGSYANSLGDKLKSQQVGKSGITDNVAFALSETLEKNELLKLKIHKSCPGEWADVVKQVEQATGSVVVGQIARTVILYRPSVSKLKAEEKREQHRRLFAQRRQKAKTAFMNQRKEQVSRQPRRGRSRRFIDG